MIDGPYRMRQIESHRRYEARNWIAKQMYRALLRLATEGGDG